MPSNAATTFGEADVILRARLDVLQQDLDAAEQMVTASTQKVAQAQGQALQQVSVAKKEVSTTDEDSGWISMIFKAITALKLLGVGIKLAGTELGKLNANASKVGEALRSVGAALTSWNLLRVALTGVRLGFTTIGIALAAIPGAAAAMSAATIAAVTAITLAVASAASSVFDINEGLANLTERAKALDGSKQKAMEFADQLARIPIIGSAVRGMFLLFSRDAKESQRIMTGWVATTEDGLVKVNLKGRLVSGTVKLITLGFVDMAGDIDKANDAMQRMVETMGIGTRYAQQMKQFAAGAGDFSRTAERDAALTGVEGPDRTRLEEQFKAEDAKKFFDDMNNSANAFHAEEIARIKDRIEQEGIGAERAQSLLDEATKNSSRMHAIIEAERIKTDKANEQAGQKRIAMAEAEAQAEKQRADAERTNRMDSLRFGRMQAELDAAGDEFNSRRVALELERRRALRDVTIQGDQELLRLTEDYYKAQAQKIDAAEAAQRQRDKELAEKAAEAERQTVEDAQRDQEKVELDQLQQNERLRSQILQERLNQAGKEAEARTEAIRQQAQEQIDAMNAAGNKAGADLVAKLRDLQIAGVQAERRTGQVRDVSRDRLSATDGRGQRDNKVRVEQQDKVVATLESIDRKLGTTSQFK